MKIGQIPLVILICSKGIAATVRTADKLIKNQLMVNSGIPPL